jgi:hypothetical protein
MLCFSLSSAATIVEGAGGGKGTGIQRSPGSRGPFSVRQQIELLSHSLGAWPELPAYSRPPRATLSGDRPHVAPAALPGSLFGPV